MIPESVFGCARVHLAQSFQGISWTDIFFGWPQMCRHGLHLSFYFLAHLEVLMFDVSPSPQWSNGHPVEYLFVIASQLRAKWEYTVNVSKRTRGLLWLEQKRSCAQRLTAWMFWVANVNVWLAVFLPFQSPHSWRFCGTGTFMYMFFSLPCGSDCAWSEDGDGRDEDCKQIVYNVALIIRNIRTCT